MADVQPENGTAPIAYAILEAFSRDPAVSISGRVMIWVLRNTYGRRAQNRGLRRKTCFYSWVKIADEIGASRSDVSRAGRRLLSTKRLVLDARGHIGLQKDYDEWAPWGERAQMPRGKCHGGKNAHERAQMRTLTVRKQQPYKGRAREVLSVQSEPERVLPAPARPANGPSLLPNGRADTLRSRAELGHPQFPPDEHPDWPRADFKRRSEHQDDWDRAQQVRENDERARQAQVIADRIAEESRAVTQGYDKREHAEALRRLRARSLRGRA